MSHRRRHRHHQNRRQFRRYHFLDLCRFAWWSSPLLLFLICENEVVYLRLDRGPIRLPLRHPVKIIIKTSLRITQLVISMSNH
jgi:hypothetical protein